MLRTHALALPLLIVLALTGCGSPPVALEPEPTAEELAYDEALAAYTNFNEVADAMAQSGGVDSEALNDVATGAMREEMVSGFEGWRENGLRQTGFTVIRSFEVWEARESERGAILAGVCEDISGTDVVNESGNSIVEPDRITVFFSLVAFDRVGGRLRVESRTILDNDEC